MKTTLNQIRKHRPCGEGWTKLLQHLNKTKADDEPLSLLTILDSNGFVDALWCLRAVKGYDKEKRLYAVWCARQVQHLMTDERSVKALDVAERYANGEASDEELKMARFAASDAASDVACNAVYAAAYDAAYAAAYAAYTVSHNMCAAYCATYHAAYAAARAAYAAYTVSLVAYDAEKAKQEAEFRRLLLSLE
jgi:hypothetical protein